jgi:hypothetical protein
VVTAVSGWNGTPEGVVEGHGVVKDTLRSTLSSIHDFASSGSGIEQKMLLPHSIRLIYHHGFAAQRFGLAHGE